MTRFATRVVVVLSSVVGIGALLGVDLVRATTTGSVDPYRVDEPGTIKAAFEERSYRPGDRAVLIVFGRSAPFTVQVFRVGLERLRPSRADLIAGTPVTARRRVVPTQAGRVPVTIPIGAWSSGMYFVRLESSKGELGFAPFVLRPKELGSSRVLVVLPTNTWQAYNFRDSDGNGLGDTWYASADVHVVDLSRPYLNRGVPPHFRGYDRGFLRWVAQTGKRADFVSDEDLHAFATGDALARMYTLVVFPGHEEYVTRHVWNVVARYRDLGGNLAFLSANSFWYRVELAGDLMRGRTLFTSEGRSPALVAGSEYVDWYRGTYPNRPYVVVGAQHAPWLFAGTELRNESTFGSFGIEIDATTDHSPPRTRVLSRIRDAFGRGRSAEMTYYTTRAGAKVFAAGVMNFGGRVESEPMRTLMENLWQYLSRP